MRMTLRRVLEAHGCQVVGEAADGAAAIARYAELRPDVVTMDITMPVMDGLTATRKILQMDRDARIIVCTAMGQKGMVLEALQAGARDFLVKPFRPQRVLEAIERATM